MTAPANWKLRDGADLSDFTLGDVHKPVAIVQSASPEFGVVRWLQADPDNMWTVPPQGTPVFLAQPVVTSREAFQRGFTCYEQPNGQSLVALSEVADLLPGMAYLDLPDGGDVTVQEQLQRMAEDAARYRWLREQRPNSLTLDRNDGPAPNYETAKQWIEDSMPELFTEVPAEELEKMKATNTIWSLQIYPRTPISFDVYRGADLDTVIDAARKDPP